MPRLRHSCLLIFATLGGSLPLSRQEMLLTKDGFKLNMRMKQPWKKNNFRVSWYTKENGGKIINIPKKTPQNSKCISLESILWVAFWDILSYTQKLRSPGAFVFWFWNGKLCDSGKPQQKSNIGFEQENTNSWLFSSSLSSFEVRQKHP